MFKAVIKSNLKRYWWIFALNMAVLFLAYIVPILNDTSTTGPYWLSIYPMMMLAAGFGALNGWCVFAYMNSTKAVNLFHSLPSTRTYIFLANVCYGGLSTLIPNFLPALLLPVLTEKYKTVGNNVNFSYIFFNCAIIGLAFFAVACFTVMFSGNAVAGKVFTPIIIGLPFFIELVFQNFKAELLYGGTYGDSYIAGFFLSSYPCGINEHGAATLRLTFWSYLVVVIVALIGAYIAYRRRHMESAGEIVTVNWAKVLFIQGAALCIGLVLTEITVDRVINFPILVVWGLVIAAAAMMILQKTYRIKGYIKQAIIYLCIVAVLFAVYELDITGYEKRVPKADKVESVALYDGNLYYSNPEFTDHELIEKLTAAHAKIVAEKPIFVYSSNTYSDSIYFTYELKNGASLSRNYQIDHEDLKTYMGEVMMTDAYKNRYFALEENWLNVAVCGRQIYFTKEEAARIKSALEKDVAEADFDALYPTQHRDSETVPVENTSIYVILKYSNLNESGQWVTINSTLPNAWTAVNEALDAHAEDIAAAEGVMMKDDYSEITARAQAKAIQEFWDENSTKIIDEVKDELEDKGWSIVDVIEGWGDMSTWNLYGDLAELTDEEENMFVYTVWGQWEGFNENYIDAVVRIRFSSENPNGEIYKVFYKSESGRYLDADQYEGDSLEDITEILSTDDKSLLDYMYSY